MCCDYAKGSALNRERLACSDPRMPPPSPQKGVTAPSTDAQWIEEIHPLRAENDSLKAQRPTDEIGEKRGHQQNQN